jgi:phosphoribosylformylglycinamidine synthase
MRTAVIVFPGTWSDHDCHHVLTNILGQEADLVWHTETDLSPYDMAILPGGFSYGDYLRTGAIARFSPVMQAVSAMAEDGRLVLGICNGFQILCESGLLPGALLRNEHLQYRCVPTTLRVDNIDTPFTRRYRQGQVVEMPISHGEGRYYADDAIIRELEETGRVVFRYADAQGQATPDANPNGSLHNIAGIVNARGNVLGMMPHPERAAEAIMGGEDGRLLFESAVKALTRV